MQFAREAFDPSAVPAGAPVWKTDDPALRQRLERSYADVPTVHRTPLTVRVRGAVGGPLEVTARDDAGREAVAVWPGPLEAARKHPLTADVVRGQLGRLGDTPFALGDVVVELAGDVLVPKSVLNDLRRRLVGDLLAQRDAAARHAVAEPGALEQLRACLSPLSRLCGRGGKNSRPARPSCSCSAARRSSSTPSWRGSRPRR